MKEDTKTMVRNKYAEIVTKNQNSCCGPSCCGDEVLDQISFVDGYEKLEGYVPDADFGLGCGLPTESARLQPGQTVLDLGSGAGNDVFIARRLVGETGRVIGLDFTPEMIDKANQNKAKLGYDNVSFVLGDIEAIPLADASVDVVISNCVLNLVPDKAKAYAEIYRVLRPGGHLAISDIVLLGELPPALREAAALYAGCIGGALLKDEYLDLVQAAGFAEVKVEKDKHIHIPPALLEQELSAAELAVYRAGDNEVRSITVYAVK